LPRPDFRTTAARRLAEEAELAPSVISFLSDSPSRSAGIRNVPLDRIEANPEQPRLAIDQEALNELAASIREHGVLQPVLVRPLSGGRGARFQLIAGERRWRAAREAGLQTVPAIVRDEGEAERLQTALIENMAREDLNPVDEARACAALVEDLGLKKKELARRLGRSRPSISNLIRLLDLPDEALDLLAAGELSEGHGRAILQAPDNDARRALAREAAAHDWSVRETERRAKEANAPKGFKVVPHPDQEAALVRAEEALESALGTGVRVRPARRGIRAELLFDDLDELLAFARERGSAG
jgi:ParB family transcriptional regulator, chromosome partitioning protein